MTAIGFEAGCMHPSISSNMEIYCEAHYHNVCSTTAVIDFMLALMGYVEWKSILRVGNLLLWLASLSLHS